MTGRETLLVGRIPEFVTKLEEAACEQVMMDEYLVRRLKEALND